MVGVRAARGVGAPVVDVDVAEARPAEVAEEFAERAGRAGMVDTLEGRMGDSPLVADVGAYV